MCINILLSCIRVDCCCCLRGNCYFGWHEFEIGSVNNDWLEVVHTAKCAFVIVSGFACESEFYFHLNLECLLARLLCDSNSCLEENWFGCRVIARRCRFLRFSTCCAIWLATFRLNDARVFIELYVARLADHVRLFAALVHELLEDCQVDLRLPDLLLNESICTREEKREKSNSRVFVIPELQSHQPHLPQCNIESTATKVFTVKCLKTSINFTWANRKEKRSEQASRKRRRKP